MLVFMQASGKVNIRIQGSKFTSMQFHPANMGKCTIHTLTENEIEISGASKHFLWVVDFNIEPFSAGAIVASTESNAELHFGGMPFGGDKHVNPGQSNVKVLEWIGLFNQQLV